MWLVQNVPLPVAEEPEAMQNHGMKYAKSFVVFCEYNKLWISNLLTFPGAALYVPEAESLMPVKVPVQ